MKTKKFKIKCPCGKEGFAVYYVFVCGAVAIYAECQSWHSAYEMKPNVWCNRTCPRHRPWAWEEIEGLLSAAWAALD